MSALTYINEYSSDSETESFEVIRAKLPSPNLSKVSIVATENHVDDPLHHGGRSRSFPHVRGNWATFVFIKYPKEDHLLKIIEKLEKVGPLKSESWQRCSDIHISLSKTFTLPYHLITPFSNNLQKLANETESFELEFSSVKVYCNEENTRTFLALTVDHFSHRRLLELTQKVDEILKDFRLPKFYEDPSFHTSIFWANGDIKSEITNILDELNIIVNDSEDQKAELIDRVCCKSGNKFFQYKLL